MIDRKNSLTIEKGFKTLLKDVDDLNKEMKDNFQKNQMKIDEINGIVNEHFSTNQTQITNLLEQTLRLETQLNSVSGMLENLIES